MDERRVSPRETQKQRERDDDVRRGGMWIEREWRMENKVHLEQDVVEEEDEKEEEEDGD